MNYDSKVFEIKYAQDSRNQYDGGKSGTAWHTLTRGYLMSRCPIVKQLLQWAEDFKKETVTAQHVEALWYYMDEDPSVVNHLLWAFFNVNLTAAAREIFCNVEDFNGLEVWRRIVLKINHKGERRRDELFDLVQHPKGTDKCEEVAAVMEDWDTNQRVFVEAGGDPLRDAEKDRILKKIVPGILVNELILREFRDWAETKDWVMEKARLLAVHTSKGTKPLNVVEPEDVDINALAEMELEEAVNSLGEKATPEILMAIVNKRQERRGGRWQRTKGSGKGTGKGKGEQETREPYKPPLTKDGKPLCANCCETGHSKTECKQPPIDKAKRVCFACKKPGHTSANCPTKSDVRNLESEDEGAAALMVEAKFVYSANSFEALAPRLRR